jgi:hypothetical protein
MHVTIRTRTGIAILAATAALAVAGCTNNNTNTANPPASTAPTTGTAPTGTPTSGGGNGGGGEGGGGGVGAATYPTDGQAYAQAALSAWAAHDQARLDQMRDPGNTIFQTISSPAYDQHFHLDHCSGAAGSTYCSVYNNVGDDLELHLNNQLLGGPHAVVSGDFHPITFPTDMQAYAQEALDAWLAHNTVRISYLLTSDAVTHLNAIATSHQADGWTFSDSQGAAGSSYLSWRNPAGDKIAFRFYNPGVVPSESPQHRIHDVLWLPHP